MQMVIARGNRTTCSTRRTNYSTDGQTNLVSEGLSVVSTPDKVVLPWGYIIFLNKVEFE